MLISNVEKPFNNDDNEAQVEVESSNIDNEKNDDVQQRSPPLSTTRQRRKIVAPRRYIEECDYVVYALNIASEVEGLNEPSTYKEAMASNDSSKWLIAMKQEMESLAKNGTWDIVVAPKKKKIVGCKWIFKRKEGPSSDIPPIYKARVVAKGYSQIEGIDFHEVFSPVVKHSSIRALLALVAMEDLELHQLDVKTAFLHGELEEEIFMKQPEGFEVAGKENHVCRLKRSLYGLKQSPRQWYKRFDSFMISHDFVRSSYDSCVYLKKFEDGSLLYLLLYVDDMLVACSSLLKVEDLKELLSSEFDMKDLGEAKKILGMEILRDRAKGVLYLSQRKYIEKVVQRFSMDDAKGVSTPLASHLKLSKNLCPQTKEEEEQMVRIPYTSAVGSVMYAMVCSRPDIAHAVSLVSRYMSNPGKGHWEALKWLLRYLKDTSNVCLMYGKNSSELTGFCDSDYGGDLDNRKSTNGDVVFDEDNMLISNVEKPFNNDDNEAQVEVESSNIDNEKNDDVQQRSPPLSTTRQRRKIVAPRRYIEECDYVVYALNIASEVEGLNEPSTYKEAMASNDSSKWLIAMKQEMESLAKNGTWDIVVAPKKKKIVGCKWIFKRKEGPSSDIPPIYKARVVAKGYSQIEGIDFHEVFSPVVKHSSIRALLALVAMEDLELHQLDVKTAFLHGELEEEIFMKQPEGFEVAGKENHVCRLKRSLYGLKQSPRQWYKRFDSFMISHDFVRSSYDSCVYLKKFEDGSLLYLLLYVDDMLVACSSLLKVEDLKELLSSEFDMKDLGEAKKILGMEILRDRAKGVLYLSQRKYIEKVVQRFSMDDAKGVSTPLASHLKLSKNLCPQTKEEEEQMVRIPYTSAVGSVMYAMVCSRPDIAHAVSLVSRYMSNPGKGHWEALKWLLRYLKDTSNVCLMYGKNSSELTGFCDSDYGGDLDNRKSTNGERRVRTRRGKARSWERYGKGEKVGSHLDETLPPAIHLYTVTIFKSNSTFNKVHPSQ
ncbi:uncharacterized protein LOC130810814 [Amaranthus tricolor]|uniref:uncharacterized protein LOC130810814 n=1 Tax=Amaranthus tricolor TaxID=29722 RepID=UPI00258499F9|nr:uncharacterized protein LOC130810814 [Amaranthus tricolor]